MHWCSWDKLCWPKKLGGMGSRRIHAFNIAMEALKQAWLLQYPNTLVARLYKARYYSSSDLIQVKRGHNPSFIWSSILASQAILREGLVWRIGDGYSVNIWQDPWLPTTREARDSHLTKDRPRIQSSEGPV
ncbi:hypothetical protein IHE45_05G121100 [Dioscorea alata]|uniref:Uncharacterized protein n=1 Tax=Dioscorea alata TaxID=55571 RepID=A0ACB7W4C2_DIOAL|nr:hypothetical protein IHE45_05G121100 [Dioscorea alata]